MKKILYSALILVSFQTYSQIGIGTNSPQATLDVREIDPSSPTAEAGIAIPQVSVLPSSGNRSGQIVFLTTTNSYYCYGGSSWQPLYTQVYTLGDVKHGFQTADHNGWILLNGRAKSTLTASQQAAATALGIGTNLPNISDKSIVGVSGTKTLNTTGGSATVTLAQNQLPNVTLSTSTDGAHTHNSGNAANSLFSSLLPFSGTPVLYSTSDTDATSSSGSHSHTTSSINGGVAQQSVTVQNPYLALNGFIYLGS
ncbi:hypothetical protein [Flavobacterium terrisoli]|uniref:hypothetical protein n=1 Tax=Flavobacterium terrisoli TaxID=3242195 RepID=UPI002543AE59|nr:hypothetical protein [Flavobacterium buctense]